MSKSISVSAWNMLTVLMAGIFFGIAICRLIPELLDTNPWWWVALAVLLLAKPLYRYLTGSWPSGQA